MLPSELKPETFNSYPTDAKKLVTDYLAVLRELPLSFLSGVLREAIDYDYKFPAERRFLEKELANLSRLSASEREDWLEGFTKITLSTKLERFDWVNAPAQFVEQLSAHLWTTHQLDAFRMAATGTRTASTPLYRRKNPNFPGWESRSSAREWIITRPHFFASFVPMGRISHEWLPRTDSGSCSMP